MTWNGPGELRSLFDLEDGCALAQCAARKVGADCRPAISMRIECPPFSLRVGGMPCSLCDNSIHESSGSRELHLEVAAIGGC